MPSTVVSSMHYYPDTAILRIRFVSGMIYDYKNVPENVYLAMKKAASKGAFLNEHVKKFYKYEKIN